MSRPEHQAPPEIFYNQEEARKYTTNSRIQEIQASLTRRALELLLLPPNKSSLLLDLGCGSGISGDVVNEEGHIYIGIDISPSMLDVALDREAQGDFVLGDLGQLIRFRAGSFDGAVSISALQWLCNADRHSHEPYRRLLCFFKWLYFCLAYGARAVFQFYPENESQVELITSAALRNGFQGGVVVDFPNSTKAKKHFLVLSNCLSHSREPSKSLQNTAPEETNTSHHIRLEGRESRQRQRKNKHKNVKDRSWILRKKEQQRHQAKVVRPDTKYTGRKRKDKF